MPKAETPLDFHPDPALAEPLYQQLGNALRNAIRQGRLRVGERLPSERDYAAQLGLSRTTVTAAYQELKDQGLLRGYVGRGVIVMASDTDQAQAGAVPWPQLGARLTRHAPPAGPRRASGDIPLSDGWLSPELVPRAALAASAARAASAVANVGSAAPPQGLPALRAALATSLTEQGTRVAPDELLITGGAQQGLNVLARALLGPGDVALVESPCWHGAFRAFRAAGADVVGVPMDHEGMDPDALEDALVRVRPKLLYLIPTLQCPTGRVMGLERRRRVLQLCERFRTPIVESHVYGDLVFGASPPSLKKLDPAGLVIQQGSASKSISPALRLGWLAAPREALSLLVAAKASLDLSTPALTQAVLADFLASGGHQRHLARLRGELEGRRDLLVRALSRHCPSLRFALPAGGPYLWAAVPAGLSGQEVEAAAALEGVSVRGGEAFLPEQGASGHIRLCYASPDAGQLAEAADRLGRALRRLRSQPPASGDAGAALAWV
ncbi:MAG: PLP-dependent aminotransferase family protein [Paucibacter sp.]|nr:PLP-dependent aminotransferase family protein [Roseateles sp.]